MTIPATAGPAGGAPVVLGVDLGTSSAKAVAVAVDGRTVADAAVEVTAPARHTDRAEQDPDDLLAALAAAVRQVTADDRVAGREVLGIGCSAAMHSLLALDRAGDPITPAIVWADNRAAAQARALADDWHAAGLAARTGTPLHPMSPLAKLRWFAEEAPDTAARAARWVSVKEYVLRRWCGEPVVDHSIAGATGLLDIETHDWDDRALALAGVERAQLSTPVPTTTVLPELDPAWAERLGVPVGTPVVVGANDGCLANLGAGAVDDGVAAITIGTSGAVRVVVDRPAGDPRGRLFCYPLTEDRWVVGGPVNNGGAVLRWARDTLFADLADGLEADGDGATAYERFDQLAGDVPPGADGLLVLPYLNGERAPLWDPTLRAVVFGLSVRHGPPHVLRALLEGVAFQLATVVEAMEAVGPALTSLRGSGGFTESTHWRQIVADVLDRDLAIPRGADGSSVGAALLALQALGVADAFALARDVRVDATIRPDPAAASTYRRVLPLYTSVRDHLREDFHALAALTAHSAPDAGERRNP